MRSDLSLVQCNSLVSPRSRTAKLGMLVLHSQPPGVTSSAVLKWSPCISFIFCFLLLRGFYLSLSLQSSMSARQCFLRLQPHASITVAPRHVHLAVCPISATRSTRCNSLGPLGLEAQKSGSQSCGWQWRGTQKATEMQRNMAETSVRSAPTSGEARNWQEGCAHR